jgi:hypothetical protein
MHGPGRAEGAGAQIAWPCMRSPWPHSLRPPAHPPRPAFGARSVFGAAAAMLPAAAAQAEDAAGVASSRMSYSRFLEYLDMGRVKKVGTAAPWAAAGAARAREGGPGAGTGAERSTATGRPATRATHGPAPPRLRPSLPPARPPHPPPSSGRPVRERHHCHRGGGVPRAGQPRAARARPAARHQRRAAAEVQVGCPPACLPLGSSLACSRHSLGAAPQQAVGWPGRASSTCAAGVRKIKMGWIVASGADDCPRVQAAAAVLQQQHHRPSPPPARPPAGRRTSTSPHTATPRTAVPCS